MGCLITSGRKVPCKSAVGGIKTIYFADFGTLGDATIVAGEITAFAGTPTWFQFDVKGNSSMETAITSSRENGTTFYESTLNVTFQNLDVATQEEIKLLNRGRAHYVVELYPDGAGTTKYLLLGKDNGAEITGGTIVTGAAPGDLQGFTITAVATDVFPPFFATAPNVDSTAPISPV